MIDGAPVSINDLKDDAVLLRGQPGQRLRIAASFI